MKKYNLPCQYHLGFLKKNDSILLTKKQTKKKKQSSLLVYDRSITAPISVKQMGWHLYKLGQK